MNTVLKSIDAVQQWALRLCQLVSEWPLQADQVALALDAFNRGMAELRATHVALVQQNQALDRHRQQLEVECRHYQDLFHLAPDGYLISDGTGIIQGGNVAIAALLHLPQVALVGKSLGQFLALKDRRAFERRLAQLSHTTQMLPPRPWETQLITQDGQVIDVAITVSSSYGHGTLRLYWLVRDITEKKQAEAKMRRQAFYDQLTQIPNRAFLDTYLPKVLAQARRQRTQVAVAFLDLDKFKDINDSLGHGVGDQLLCRVARRLVQCLRGEDLLVRWGGDEFVLVISRLTTVESVLATCDRILASLQPIIPVDNHPLRIGTSIGIALFPQDGTDPTTLLRHADQALYRAKNQGRNTYCFYQIGLPSPNGNHQGTNHQLGTEDPTSPAESATTQAAGEGLPKV